MNICQHPVVFAIGYHTAAVGALAGRGDLSWSTAVGAVGDGVALAGRVGLHACLAVEDHLITHVPITSRVTFQHLLSGVLDDIVAHHGIEPYHKDFLFAVFPERIQRAVLDADLLDHVSLAHADVFIQLLLVLVEQVLALEGTDGLPVLGGPCFLNLHEHLTGEADELVGRERGVVDLDLCSYHCAVVKCYVVIGLVVYLLVDIRGIGALFLFPSSEDEIGNKDNDQDDQTSCRVVDKQTNEVAYERSNAVPIAKVATARAIAVLIAHVTKSKSTGEKA